MALEHGQNGFDEGLAGGVEHLVVLAKAGDAEAFGILATRFKGHAYAAAFRVVRNHHDAQDVVQLALWAMFRKIGQLEEPKAFGGWLRAVVRNTAINYLDRSRCKMTVSMNAPFPGDGNEDWNDVLFDPLNETPQEILIDREDRSQMRDGLDDLRHNDRRALELFHLQHESLLSMRDILSEEEGRDVPVGTIKRRLHVARKRLKNMVKDS